MPPFDRVIGLDEIVQPFAAFEFGWNRVSYAPYFLYGVFFVLEYERVRRRTRFLFKKKAAKKTIATNSEKNCGIFSAAGLYRQPPKGRRLT